MWYARRHEEKPTLTEPVLVPQNIHFSGELCGNGASNKYNEQPVNPTSRGKKLGEGTFALQAHDPKSIIHYKNIRVKRLE